MNRNGIATLLSFPFGTLCFALLICWCAMSNGAAQDEGPQNTNADGTPIAPPGVIAVETFEYSLGRMTEANGGFGWNEPWRTSYTAAPDVQESSLDQSPGKQQADQQPAEPAGSKATLNRGIAIRGTGARNNPLRRELETGVTSGELFVRFTMNYGGAPTADELKQGEFFVLWLDRMDGGDRATHSNNVPNIGVRVVDKGPNAGRNMFMVRIGTKQVAWSQVEMQHGQTYDIVAQLSKSKANEEPASEESGEDAAYDTLALWIDPQPKDFGQPDAVARDAPGIKLVRWIGFSTAQMTAFADEVQVDSLLLAESWEAIVAESSWNFVPRSTSNEVVWDQPVDFAGDIYPLLKSRCFDCHAGDQPYSGVRLDIRRELLGYSSGEVLAEPGLGHSSKLIEAVSAEDAEERMPPDGDEPLTAEQIAMLRAWIDRGMKWDEQLLPTPKLQSDHWAFQPVSPPTIPRVNDTAWLRTPVDAFIARAQAAAGVVHSEEASRQILVRRLYLDLIGLPPTPEQMDAFVNDSSPNAYERLVEELLESPHYGERWGRYWLDLARWAESQGYQHDIVRPFAWRYRDYVIDSFNKDKPYDTFIKEQLAGDELEPYSDEQLIATGFLGAARISGNQEDESIQRNDVLVDIANTTGSAMLGLTMGCAQCHNHKFDPISQRDYYRLQGFFVRGQLGNLSLQDEVNDNQQDLSEWIPKAGLDFYKKEVKSLVGKKLFQPTDQPHTWGFLSSATGNPQIVRYPVVNRKPIAWQPELLKRTEPRMMMRGDATMPGPGVGFGWPEVLGETPNDVGEKRRSALADWMADPQNPLVARVWVNRLWQYHFGRGIVATPSDFGVEGAEPSHPELLDWLATELMQNGWSTKHIHRLIVLSATYRQQHGHHAANAALDPDNKLLWNWPQRRLEAEAIRDAVLTATGELDRAIGGISVPPQREEDRPRRTIYLFQQRSDMPKVMSMFDGPDVIASCAHRAVSTVPLQPLYLLNSQFMANRAKALARAVVDQAGDDIEQQIRVAFRRTLCREPDAAEIKLASKMLTNDAAPSSVALENGEPSDDPLARLARFCHALLNLNEFVYIP